jgi:hypothetical protein
MNNIKKILIFIGLVLLLSAVSAVAFVVTAYVYDDSFISPVVIMERSAISQNPFVFAGSTVAYVFQESFFSSYEPFDSPFIVVKKPAIYLYPKTDAAVSVKLSVNGAITNDVPSYGNGWNVFATKEGVIDGKYDYLFYEAKLNKVDVPSEGWIVKYNDLGSWFDVNLKKLGLNEKETSQFKEYWLAELPESKYYDIRLLTKDYLDENMKLSVSPSPDTLIRVEFLFKPLNEYTELKEPKIATPVRQGFVVVEWGGVLDSQK